MANEELLGYVRKQLALNIPKETIAGNLKGAGWSDEDVNEVFAAIAPLPASAPSASGVAIPVTPTAPVANAGPIAFPVASAVPFETPHVSKSHKLASMIVVLIFLCLAGGAATYAYYTGAFVSFPNLVGEAIDNAQSVTSSKYDVAFSIDLSELKDESTGIDLSALGIDSKKASFNIRGMSDMSDPKNVKNSAFLSFSMGTLFAQAEFRLVDKIFYVQLTKAPALSMLPVPALSEYEHKWFSIPLDGKDMNNPLLAMSPTQGINLSDEQKIQTLKILQKSNFIKKIAKLAPETFDGESTHHFSFDLDREGLVAFMVELRNYLQTTDQANPAFAGLDPIKMKEDLEGMKNFKGEIWIGRSDKLVHKLAVSFGASEKDQTEQVKINIVATMSDYNQPVIIVAPAESTSFQDLIGNMFAPIQEEKPVVPNKIVPKR